MKKLYIYILLLASTIHAWSQENNSGQVKKISLKDALQGNKTYVAAEEISLLRNASDIGFSYKASAGQEFNAYLDNSEIFPSDFLESSQSKFRQVLQESPVNTGSIKASFNVSSLGSASYTIPIEIPAGVNSIQPHISATYNSNASDGLVGVGWSLTGLSSIVLAPQNIFTDGNYFPVWPVEKEGANSENRLTLDGKRLILIDPTDNGEKPYPYLRDGNIYTTENHSYNRITYTKSSGDNYFVIERSNGVKMYYGTSNDSKFINRDDYVLMWYLKKVEDDYGNFCEYTYFNSADEGYLRIPSRIDYGNKSKTIYSIQFQYQVNEGVELKYLHGEEVNNQVMLEQLTIKKGDNILTQYNFEYFNHLNKHYLNKVVQKMGNTKTELPATYFNYDEVFKKITLTQRENPNQLKQDDVHYTNWLHQVPTGEELIEGVKDVFQKEPRKLLIRVPSNTIGDENSFKRLIIQYFDVERKKFLQSKIHNISIEDVYETIYTEVRRDRSFYEADLNGDGISDIFSIFKYPDKLNIDGTEEDDDIIYYINDTEYKKSITGLYSGAVIADFDGDGRVEILIHKGQQQGEKRVFTANGNKYFHSNFKDDDIEIYTVNSSNNLVKLTPPTGKTNYGFSFPTSGLHTIYSADMNADGREDLVIRRKDDSDNKGLYIAYSFVDNNGRIYFDDLHQKHANRCYSKFPIPSGTMYIVDYNGDGAPEIITGNSNGIDIKYLDLDEETLMDAYEMDQEYWKGYNCEELSFGDVNGDGLIDFYNGRYLGYSPGRCDQSIEKVVDMGEEWENARLGIDFNGDGKSDFYKIILDRSKATYTYNYRNDPIEHDLFYYKISIVATTDLKNSFTMRSDHRIPLPQAYDDLMTSLGDDDMFEWHYFGIGQETFPSNIFNLFDFQMLMGDFNGDGITDYYGAISASKSAPFNLTDYTKRAYTNCFPLIYNTDVPYQPLKLKAITDGSQLTTLINYEILTNPDIYSETTTINSWEYPLRRVRGPLIVVSDYSTGTWEELTFIKYINEQEMMENSLFIRDNFDLASTQDTFNIVPFEELDMWNIRDYYLYCLEPITTHMKYQNLWSLNNGKGLLGFDYIESENLVTGTKTINTSRFNSTYGFSDQVTKTNYNNGNTLNSTVSNFDVEPMPQSDYSEAHYFVYLKSQETTDHLVNATTTTTNSYASGDFIHGNPSNITKTISGGYSENIINTYEEFGDAGFYRLDEQMSVKSKTNEANYKTSQVYDYYDEGENPRPFALKSKTNKFYKTDNTESDLNLVTEFTYNEFGNISKKTSKYKSVYSDNNEIEEIQTVSYKYRDGLFLEEKTTEMGNTAYSYNEYGLKTSETNEFGLKTTFTYDALLRPYTEISPDGITKTQEHGRGGEDDDYSYYTKVTVTGFPDAYTYYDKYGREILQKTFDLNNNAVLTNKSYNTKGELIQETQPHYKDQEEVVSTYLSYHPDGRLAEQYQGLSEDIKVSLIEFTYLNKETTVKRQGEFYSNQKVDGAGNTIESIDPGGKISYTINALGEIRLIDAPGNTIEIQFDEFGNKKSHIDNSIGIISYLYNPVGKILEQTDQHGILTRFYYNSKGLIIQKEITESNGTRHTIDYTYDNKFTTSIANVTMSNGTSTSFTYDHLGRLQKRKETVEGEHFEWVYTYDGQSRILTERYPSGFTIKNVYKSNGFLYQVKNAGTDAIIWQANETDALGNLTNYQNGNGEITTEEYNSYGILKRKKVGSFYDMGYNFDLDRVNLNSRTDNIRGLTERFTYDDFDRLLSWCVNSKTTYHSTYNSDNAINSKSDASSSSYSYLPDAPHKLYSVDVNNESHISRYDHELTYNEFDKTASIANGDGVNELSILYNYTEERIKSELTQNNSNKFTKYYFGNYEVEIHNDGGGNKRRVHYILGAIFIDNTVGSGNDTMYYVHTDYLGSILAITNNRTNQKSYNNFDPWGRLRDPQTWEYSEDIKLAVFDRGYTGHQHLVQFQLINMNGRMYDPVLGMFLSPDNYLQNPANSQNYNGYTYCFNNPLVYTDPTGEYAVIDDIIAAAVGGIINLAVNAFQGNLSGYGVWEGIGRGFAAFGAGAVGGWGALYPEFGGWVWGGATVGATNAWLSGATTGKEIAIGAGVGAISGIAGGAAGQWGGQYIGGVIINGTQVTSPVLQGAITGAAGGAVGGYAGGFTGGLIMTGDLKQANQAGLNGLWTGAAVGGVVGAGSGYKYAIDNKINPWNGDLKINPQPQYDFTPDPYGDNVTMYRGTTGTEGNGGPLFMTDNPDYAATYVRNGGQVVKVTISRSTYLQMQYNGHIQTYQGGHGGSYGYEYQIHPTVAPDFLNLFKF